MGAQYMTLFLYFYHEIQLIIKGLQNNRENHLPEEPVFMFNLNFSLTLRSIAQNLLSSHWRWQIIIHHLLKSQTFLFSRFLYLYQKSITNFLMLQGKVFHKVKKNMYKAVSSHIRIAGYQGINENYNLNSILYFSYE